MNGYNYGNTAKNIVICLDGTGNQIEENLSNILKLYRTLLKNEYQVVFYDQGVGTLKKTSTWGRWKQKARHFMGLAFGYELDRNVLKAYEFPVQNYQEQKIDTKFVRDDIFIFGFSRGAHTARVLAGLIYEIGILRPEQIHLSSAALIAYKQSTQTDAANLIQDEEAYEGEGMNFRRVTNSRTAAIKFLGVFDTVSSVLIPNANSYFPPLVMERLLHTQKNPAVKNFRHAIVTDERRRMFRVDHWKKNQRFKPNKHSIGEPEEQDAKEVWFGGYHSDVGGGHERNDSGLSQIPLIWMLEQAKSEGLQVFDRMAEYVTGVKLYTSTTKYKYPEPKVKASVHDSMSWQWAILEYWPKPDRYREWPDRKSFWGYYLPCSEPRFIESDAVIHPSHYERKNSMSNYRPENTKT